jgi:hypothetical protein
MLTHLPLPPPTKLADGLGLKDALLTIGETHPKNRFLRLPQEAKVLRQLGVQRILCYAITARSDPSVMVLAILYPKLMKPQPPNRTNQEHLF